MMKIESYGAAGTVTGSNHLLETAGQRLLLDCGLFQGGRALDALNDDKFAYDLASIDALLLSHAHLDHSGRVPKLVRDGYRGPIYALEATRELARALLLDAAKLQREDYERDQRKGRPATPPLYDEDDVDAMLARFQIVQYGKPFDIGGARVKAHVAGHIPGSAFWEVESGDGRFVFSGDLGNARKVVLPDPEPCPDADLVLVESTYGDRDHRGFKETIEEFASLVRRAADRGGKILIPTFALERTQDILYHLARLEDAGQVPVLPVFVDSPLASKVEDVYSACHDEFSQEVKALYAQGRDPFAPRELKYTRSVQDSKALNELRGPAIILAGAGMLTGGRILHHLVHHLPSADTTLIIVGYQPEGGLGRRLIDGAQHVRVFGDEVQVRANIATIGGFSAHADRTELLAWTRQIGAKGDIRAVHGEPRASEALVAALNARGQQARVQSPAIPLPTAARDTDGE